MWSFFSRVATKDFPYEIDEPTVGTDEFLMWKLHKGRRKDKTEENVSIFVLDAKAGGSGTQLALAKAAVKRLKTLRHPNILTYIDSLETENCVYLVTESVQPLFFNLRDFPSQSPKDKQQKELFIAWGLFQVTRGLSFLNNDCHLQHNSVCKGSIFVNTAGEWKLGGVEYTTPSDSDNPFPVKILPSLLKYDPPEKSDSSKRLVTAWSTDMWGLGCLIWEVFNGSLKSPTSLKSLGNIPKLLGAVYCELVGANPASRLNPKEIVIRCRKEGGYFHNDLVDCLLFLEEIQIKDASDKTRFFSSLSSLLDSFPENLSRHKILPQLINAFDFGNAGSAILAPMFKLGSLLSEDEYQKRIVPCVIKLFSSPDRATRARLLQQLEFFADHLLPNTVNDQIFPHVVNGFVDSNPIIREHTVKSILFLSSKLNYNNLNVEVLRHFARLQASDEQGGIRTNTTVCLGKVASNLHPQIRQKVLVSAFTRALRDPFPPARIAGLMALAATQHYYTLNQISQSVLPSLCGLTCDPEREVRDQVFKVIKGFLSKLEKVSEDPSLKESMEADVNANASSEMTNVASTWAGWAVNAVTSKFYKSQSIDKNGGDGSESRAASPAKSKSTPVTATAASSEKTTSKTPKVDEDNVSESETNWESNNWGDMNASWA